MARGGSRNRSGPPPAEDSERSEHRGFKLTALPASYGGPVPDFPLEGATDRELALWEEKWRGPHGAAWSQPSEAWRLWDVALWVRTAVRCEQPDAGASLIGNLHRLGDRVGLSTAGLAEMGWKIVADEVGERRAESKPDEGQSRRSSRDRMKVVAGGDG